MLPAPERSSVVSALVPVSNTIDLNTRPNARNDRARSPRVRSKPTLIHTKVVYTSNPPGMEPSLKLRLDASTLHTHQYFANCRNRQGLQRPGSNLTHTDNLYSDYKDRN